MTPVYVTAPPHVVACELESVTVLMDYRYGNFHTLSGQAAIWWAQLASTGDLSRTDALDITLAKQLAEELQNVGLLIRVPNAEPWSAPIAGLPWLPSWGTQEVPAGRAPVPRTRLRMLAVGLLALLLTLAVLHTGHRSNRMARLLRLAQWATRRTTHPASPAQASEAVYAIRRVGLAASGRVACLEESVAVVLTLALYRQRVTWCHGVAADPVRLHAWVETSEGHPVAEPASTSRYTALRTIPER